MKTISLLFSISVLFIVSAFGQEGKSAITGTVKDTKGNRLGGVSVTARRNGTSIMSATTDGRGEFILSSLDPGNYVLLLEKERYASGATYNIEVKKGQTRKLGDRLILELDKGWLVYIQGTVFDSTGRGLPGASVKIELANSDKTFRTVGNTKSSFGDPPNARGDFRFRFSEANTQYRITASFNGVSNSKVITVDDPGIYRLAISLEVVP